MAFQPKFNFPPIRALLIDISGTLLIGSSPTPRAAEAIATLRAARIPFRLCSNTSKESSSVVHERMRAAGLDVHRDELWTSVGALRAVLDQLEVKRPYMLLSKSALEECMDGRVQSSSPDSPYDAVVVGLAPSLLDYAHLNTAFRILVGEHDHRPRETLTSQPTADPLRVSPPESTPGPESPQHPRRPPLIALHKARYIEVPDHALSLGPGPFVLALEHAARTSATVVGKPTRAFFETVLRDLEREFNREPGLRSDAGPISTTLSRPDSRRWEGIAVIGDDVLADLGEGAVELGLWRVLVKTGKYRSGDEDRKDAPAPDQICVSFAEFVDMLVEQRRSLP